MVDASPLFDYMRSRHQIYLRRKQGLPRAEWTDDWIFQQYRFCNVFRELDRTTIWFRENVREKVPVDQVLLATVLFRWFNRITSGEAIWLQTDMETDPPGATAWDQFVGSGGNTSAIHAALRQYCGKGPYVTGSYIIKTPDGYNKLEGVLWCVDRFYHFKRGYPEISLQLGVMDWKEVTEFLMADATWAGTEGQAATLEGTWNWLRQFPYLGDFCAYEIVTDLRHTSLLDRAPDIMTWANPGPGAMRGLNRMHGRDLKSKQAKQKYIDEMRELLFISEDRELWPFGYPALEMRDIEHSLCELDKYLRVKNGEGAPRQRFS